MFSLIIQLLIEEVLSGGRAYIASHPELGVPLGIFNDIDEPDYNSRVKNIKLLGKQGSKRSLSFAKIYGINNPLPSFLEESDADKAERLEKALKASVEQNEKLLASSRQYNNDLKGATESWDSITKSIKASNNVLIMYKNMVTNTMQQMAAFTMNTREQYDLSEKIAESYKASAYSLGLSTKQSKLIEASFKAATPLVARYGGEVRDLEAIYTELGDQSGRIQFLTQTELENVYLMGAALKMSEQDSAAMADRFQLMGVNIESMYKTLSLAVEDARSMGLNSQKVLANLEQNFASMQRMSFVGGVSGMVKMAKLATEMRMDISEMLGMAEKFYEPEAAIEAAAELQLMGGDIAAAFGDPFEVMYLARNKPQELAQKVADMTENMMIFNKESGEYELPPEARQQLTFMADKLGLAKDNIIDTAFQANKLKDVKESFGKGSMFSEEQMSALSQMAQFDTASGEWKVTVGNQKLGLDDNALKTAVTDGLLSKEDEKGGKTMAKMVDNTFTTNQLLQNILEEFKTGVSIETDFYDVGVRVMEDSVKNIGDGSKILLKTVSDEVAKAAAGTSSNLVLKMLDKGFQDDVGEKLGETVKVGFKFAEELISKGPAAAFGNLTTKLETSVEWFEKFNTQLQQGSGNIQLNTGGSGGSGSGGNVQVTTEKTDFLSRADGKVIPFTGKDDIFGAMKGGPIDKLFSGGFSTPDGKVKIEPIKINGDLSINIKTSTGIIRSKIENDELVAALLPALKSQILNKLGHGDAFNGLKGSTSNVFPDEF